MTEAVKRTIKIPQCSDNFERSKIIYNLSVFLGVCFNFFLFSVYEKTNY